MTRLADDLLDLSRISRGRLELRRTRLDFHGVIDAAVELTRPVIDGHKHELRVKYVGAPLPIEGDFERLLSNAAKYMEPDGTIARDTRVSGDQAFVHVGDSGLGIPRERLENVFEMSSQVPEHRALTGGVGIGLALSRRLLALHGGAIAAKSEGLGHGSEFIVRLPLAAADEEAVEFGLPDRSAPRPASQRILIIDDNVDAAEALRVALEIQGHVIESRTTGQRRSLRWVALLPIPSCSISGCRRWTATRSLAAFEAARTAGACR